MVSALLFAGALPARAQTATPQNAMDPMRIGLSVPLSGNYSRLARAYADGAQRALDESAVPNRPDLMIVDDGCDPDLAELAAEDLLDAQVGFSFGYFCNLSASIATTRLSEKDIAVIVTNARGNVLMADAQKNNWLVWKASPSDEAPAIAAASALSVRWQNTPFAVVDDGTIFGRSLADEFRTRMISAGMEPVFTDTIRAAQSTQAPLVRRLTKAGASAVFIGAEPEDVAMVARNVKELGVKLDVVGNEGMEMLAFAPKADQMPEGTLAILEPAALEAPKFQPLIAALKAEGVELIDPYFLRGYADMQLALQVAADSGKPLTGKEYETNLQSVVFGNDRKNTINPFGLYRWTGERFIAVEDDKPASEGN